MNGGGFSAIFIRRPVATMLLAVGLFLTGMVAFDRLPVAPLPKVDFPTISVSARLPGADPATMAATVAAPLERRLGEIPGVSEMTSTSTQGSTSITVQFDLDRSINGAAHDVQAAINAAASDLAIDLPSPPTYRKINPAEAPIMILAVTSDSLTSAKVFDAADAIMASRISQVEGVAQVSLSGAEKPAVRVRVNPGQLAAMGVGLEDVRTALANANVNIPKGSLDGAFEAMSIGANDQLFTASAYAPLIIKSSNGAIVRLSAVASVVDSVENTRLGGWFNRDKAVLIIISKQPGANVVETVDRIREILPQLRRWMPAGTKVSVVSDRTVNIRGNLDDVETTLAISIGLVVMVVYLTLGRMTPTLAASVTVPLSLAATFAFMWLVGYSLNNISLMAVTISVGFVVDDAIVMIENITRHMEKGEGPLEAAIKGSKEIVFTVVSITMSLVAVFIPLLFMGGILGRLFREFAVTLSVAIVVSAIVSLTVTPTLFGHLMVHAKPRPLSGLAKLGDAAMAWLEAAYERSLARALAHRMVMLGVTLGTVGLTVFLYGQVAKGFFPPQDTGMILVSVEGRVDVSFRTIAERQQKVAEVVLSDPAVEGVGSFVGSGGPGGAGNTGRMFVDLKPLGERKESAQDVINRLRPKLGRVEGVAVFLMAGQDIRIGGRMGKAQFQFVLFSESLEELREWTPKLLARLKSEPGLVDVSSDQDAAIPQMQVVVDRDAAARMGVSMNDVDQVLQNAFAQRQVSTIYTQRNQYKVVLELDPRFQEDPSSLHLLWVKSKDGGQVPLDSLAHFETTTAPVSVAHQGQFPAATLTFNLAPGVPLGDAALRLQSAAREIGLPAGVRWEFAGNAKVFAESLKDQPVLILAALLAIYIVLGVLYESLLHPITIISTLPSAGIGALLALMGTNTELTLISVIGVFLLMGIVKKNGILMVDFAIEAERRGAKPLDAILDACRTRFRPIIMTTLTALLGAVPLALASGPGGALRRPLGIAIVGGLVLSQLLTLYTTPVVYLWLARLAAWRKGRVAA
ncbi:Cobalt-zinc-cadmium resistance protein CzcA Cation efflux system protein CusA [Paramagnetospirillum magnetotacticum MS-1]|uniref:Cobalt-zinc-cadmium resistance protein CzcA Cation efflux system protein CusA n=1 Tax=Paramagnetospirillum magnetotacticum MS-1 TaxID=272627 RepID=A0A0C2YYV9_PARME|nr:efflux RND transporter permease subunit [Paramagnetospirillum magnetotacticum]KIL99855.1 Cobalt-zinc-cadmium resistance protein CzcA Cation efflux system protein CusA [Paramagnetospirillum magnetotacticum MS-1]